MSRYEFVPDGWSAPYSLTLSWDKPWRAYVALVNDKSVPLGQDWVSIRIGCSPPHDHYPDLDDMLRALNESIKGKLPPVTLSNRMRMDLTAAKREQFEKLRQQGIDPTVPLDFSNDDDDEDDRPSHSLAYPPIYVLRCAWSCPECGRAVYFYSLGCDAYCDRDFGYDFGSYEDPIVDFHFLQQVESVPGKLLKLLKKKCPSFYLDLDPRNGSTYLMNHCQCGAKLDDDYVSGDVGAVFYPDTPDGYADFQLFLLPIDEPMPVNSSYMLGGGEYLDYDKAKPFAELPEAKQSAKRPNKQPA